MGSNTDHLSCGFYTAGREYLDYPKYRSHASSKYANPTSCTPYVPHNVPYYRIHHCHGESTNLGAERSSLGHWDVMDNAHNNRQAHRCHIKISSRDSVECKNGELFNMDEKTTMQSLNGRLASYLENVKLLEEENDMLEKKICEWCEKYPGKFYSDLGPYLQIIADLQKQVLIAGEHNARLVQRTNDGHIVNDDYTKKCEVEFKLRAVVEEDLRYHIGILEDINRDRCNLCAQIQHLEEEIHQLKTTSSEEISNLQAQLGTRVNVEVENSPSVDLSKALSDIRKEYEGLLERNLNDIENTFNEMSCELSRAICSGAEQLLQFNNEVMELTLQKNTMETELEMQLSLVSVENSTLAEVNEDYSSLLSHLQNVIDVDECQLEQIQSKVIQLTQEYKIYMDMKSRLEREIVTYTDLLEAHNSGALRWSAEDFNPNF